MTDDGQVRSATGPTNAQVREAARLAGLVPYNRAGRQRVAELQAFLGFVNLLQERDRGRSPRADAAWPSKFGGPLQAHPDTRWPNAEHTFLNAGPNGMLLYLEADEAIDRADEVQVFDRPTVYSLAAGHTAVWHHAPGRTIPDLTRTEPEPAEPTHTRVANREKGRTYCQECKVPWLATAHAAVMAGTLADMTNADVEGMRESSS